MPGAARCRVKSLKLMTWVGAVILGKRMYILM
jgi:hypothetical protein